MDKKHLAAADKIYKQIRHNLEKQHKGKIIAIEVNSGEYFIGDTVLEAYNNGKAKHPDSHFVFKRIGFPALAFVGAF
ncbi:hypothetical protein HY605_03735 [Candidatus Peregrinibacteria bacterium]|nr:hypothetical protein [Candidatus Peregrinibacteria bacterium]